MSAAKTPPDTKTLYIGDASKGDGRLKEIGGSKSDLWNNTLANQTLQTIWFKHANKEEQDKLLSATLAALMGIGPKDEHEGMVAAQMIAAHHAAMECFRRAMLNEQTFEGRRENLAQANKLSRTHAMLLEALNRHRGKGQQKVTVEHVHVHAGGQAIVGTVETGGGVANKTEEQPHAKEIAHASGVQVSCEDEARCKMPITRDAKR